MGIAGPAGLDPALLLESFVMAELKPHDAKSVSSRVAFDQRLFVKRRFVQVLLRLNDANPSANVFETAYSKDHNDRTPPLTFRTYQILPHTNSYFHSLYSYLDLLPQGPLEYPRGAKPPWYPRSYWRRSR